MATSHEDVFGDKVDDIISNFFSTESDLSSVPSCFDDRAAHKRVASYVLKEQDDQTRDVLTSFLDFLPDDSKQMLAEFVVFLDDEQLHCLYQHLLTSILMPMKARSATPQITPSLFEDFHKESEITTSSMGETPMRTIQKLLKVICLHRDGFQCLATGLPEVNAVKAGLVSVDPSPYPCDTELAHIIPFSIGHWEDRDQDYKVSQIWTTLRKCFPRIGLGPQEINDQSNLMTLEAGIHRAFGLFRITFEATRVNLNEYFILTFEPGVIQAYLPRPDVYGIRKITFRQHSDAALPSPEVLEVHCVLAKILHASGMSERIDKIIQEREELKCLANDGSSDAKTLLFAF